MRKLYKFYKDNCAPCKAMDKLLERIELPDDVELVYLDVGKEEGRQEAKRRGIQSVPSLAFEDGSPLIGMKTEEVIKEFINSYSKNE